MVYLYIIIICYLETFHSVYKNLQKLVRISFYHASDLRNEKRNETDTQTSKYIDTLTHKHIVQSHTK